MSWVWPKNRQNNDLSLENHQRSESVNVIYWIFLLTVVWADPVSDRVIGPFLGGVPSKVHSQSQPGILQVLTVRIQRKHKLPAISPLTFEIAISPSIRSGDVSASKSSSMAVLVVAVRERGRSSVWLSSVLWWLFTSLSFVFGFLGWTGNKNKHDMMIVLIDFYFFEFKMIFVIRLNPPPESQLTIYGLIMLMVVGAIFRRRTTAGENIQRRSDRWKTVYKTIGRPLM